AGARTEWLAAAVTLSLLVELAKTARWAGLLRLPLTGLPRLFALVLNARLLNALMPLRAGDLWRVAAVARGEGRPLVVAGGSVLVEKLLDGAALALVALLLLSETTLLPRPPLLAAGLLGLAALAL